MGHPAREKRRMPSRPDPTEELRAHFRSERHATDRHPSPEQIVAYHEQRLPPGEAEEIRAHLAACPDCTAQLLALVDLLDEEDGSEAKISPADLDAAWERQRSRLFPEPPPLPTRVRAVPLRRPRVLPASLGLAAALLAIVSLVQWRTIVQLRQPQANPPLINLEPAGSVRQGAPVAELSLPASAQRVWVILNPVAELDASDYDVEIAAPDGAIVLRFESLQRSEVGNFRLEVPRGVLADGDYRIVLFGRKAGRREAVEEFALRVRPVPLPAS